MFANPAQAFNAFAFTLPGQTGSRNTLRGDGIFNIDASVSKRFLMPYNEKSDAVRREIHLLAGGQPPSAAVDAAPAHAGPTSSTPVNSQNIPRLRFQSP